MHSIRWILSVSLLTAVLAAPARAEIIHDLDEGQVPVTTQDADERAAAVRTALMQVLVKVTGNRQIAADPKVKGLLDNAQNYVQKYRYRPAPPPPGAAAAVATPGSVAQADQEVLWVHFDGDAIARDLSRLGIPVWGKSRPAILLWLAVDEGDQRYIVAGDHAPDLQQGIAQEARQRGVLVYMPVFDLEDQMALTFADVWGDFEQTIQKASARYRPDAVLVGRIYQASGGVWQGRWTLYQGGQAGNTWDAAAGGTEQAAVAGIDGVADTLAQQFAHVINPTATAALAIEVTGVTTARDYARVMKYLSGLEPVAQTQVTRVAPGSLDIELSLLSDPRRFAQRLSLDTVLAPDTTPGQAPAPGGGVLVYRLSP